MARLLDCSHELLHNIFLYVDPVDLAALSRTCRSLSGHIRGNKLLCRELYLKRWDKPAVISGLDWEHEMQALVRLEKVFTSDDLDYKRDSLEFAASLIPRLASVPDPKQNVEFLASAFRSQDNVDAILARSSLYRHGGTDRQRAAPSPELRQAAAHLHCLFGVPVDSTSAELCIDRARSANLRSHDAIHGSASSHHDMSTSPAHNLRSATRPRIPANHVARAKIYDLRQYTNNNRWGPFVDDGSMKVDWERMEAIMVLMVHNLRLFSSRTGVPGIDPLWYRAWEGLSANSFANVSVDEETSLAGIFATLRQRPAPALSARDSPLRSEKEMEAERTQRLLDEEDPYGVTGTWMRVVCFLDYNDLYAFNFARTREQIESTHGIDTKEAVRLIRLKTKVTRIVYPKRDREEDSDSSSDFDADESLAQDGATDPDSGSTQITSNSAKAVVDDYSDWPIVYFTGSSRSLHSNWDPNANSRLRGRVQMTKNGDVRWTTWSIFHGEERWRSEGVQVGGPKSARGILGTWFDKDYERQGPAGPTAFWKISNEVADDADDEPAMNHTIPQFLWPGALDNDDVDEEIEVDMEGPDPDEESDNEGNNEVQLDRLAGGGGRGDASVVQAVVNRIASAVFGRPHPGMIWNVTVNGQPDPAFEAELREAAGRRGFGVRMNYGDDQQGDEQGGG